VASRTGRRPASTEPAAEGPGSIYLVVQPALFWPTLHVERADRRLGEIHRGAWGTVRYEDSEGRFQGRFSRDVLTLRARDGAGTLEARAAGPRGATVMGARLSYPDPVEAPQARLAPPVGEARAFLENGYEDSAAYYVSYALGELNGSP
jgi:hypothetical protein